MICNNNLKFTDTTAVIKGGQQGPGSFFLNDFLWECPSFEVKGLGISHYTIDGWSFVRSQFPEKFNSVDA